MYRQQQHEQRHENAYQHHIAHDVPHTGGQPLRNEPCQRNGKRLVGFPPCHGHNHRRNHTFIVVFQTENMDLTPILAKNLVFFRR